MSRWSRAKSKNKYGNVTSLCALGHSHPSKLESALCQFLQLREKAGEIKLLQVQDHVYLTDARILYIPDFKCHDLKTGETFWAESKGIEGERWATIKKLWKFFGPGRLEIWKGTHTRLKLVEEIIPYGKGCDEE